MKLGRKLTLTFVFLSMFALIPVAANWHLGAMVRRSIEERNIIHDIAENVDYEEVSATRIITAPDAQAVIAGKEFRKRYRNNEALFKQLLPRLQTAEERKLLERVRRHHQRLYMILENSLHAREKEVVGKENVTRLAEGIRDVRRKIKNVYFPESLLRGPLNEEILYEIRGAKKKSSVVNLFREMELREKEYIWQKKDPASRLLLHKSIDEFEYVASRSNLPHNVKKRFASVMKEYRVALSQIEEVVDTDDIELLVRSRDVRAEELQETTDAFAQKLFSNPSIARLAHTPFLYRVGNEEFFESLKFAFTTMLFREKEYIWQYHDREWKEIFDGDVEKVKLVAYRAGLPDSTLDELEKFLAAYSKEVYQIEDMNSRISQKLRERDEKKSKILMDVSAEMVAMIGSGASGDGGLERLATILEEKTNDATQASVITGLIVGGATVLIALFIGVIVSGAISKPIVELRKAAIDIGRGDLTRSISVSSKDEIGELADSFSKMTRDLTSSRNALMESESRYRTLFERSPEPIIIISLDGTIQYCNRNAFKAFSNHLLLGKSIYDLKIIDRQTVSQNIRATNVFETASEESIRNIETCVDINGEKKWFHINIAPIQKDEKTDALQITAHDITVNKNNELELEMHRGRLQEIVDERTKNLQELNRELIEQIRVRKAAEKELLRGEQNMRALAQKTISAQEEERTRLARDLHDQMGQQLSALGMEIEWLSKKTSPDPALMSALSGKIEKINLDLQAIYRGLRPMELEKLGLSAAMQSLIWQTEERAKIKINSEIEQTNRDIRPEVSISLYRILQESLTNIVRHSGAKHVVVRFKASESELALIVKDDGKGFEPESISAGKSFGVAGMRERVALCGGSINIGSEIGKGTTLQARIPL